MEQQQTKYDVIIVGLGCFGLGSAYYLARQGLKVLGLERNSEVGAFGSGSVGCGRIWRYLHSEHRYAKMQEESAELFRELEQKTGQEMLKSGGLLYMKPKGHPDLLEFQKYGELLTSEQINQRWPAFRIPDYIEGVFALEAGVVRVKNALSACKNESVKLGADLRFNSNVSHIDHVKGRVTLEDGRTFEANQIVVTCGATTDQFYQTPGQFKVHKQGINCYFLSDREGLPTAFLLEGLKETNGIMVFGTVDGDDFTKYKVGNELDNQDPHIQLKVMKLLMPSKVDRITHVMPCFYSMSADDEFIFEKHGNTVFGFGCNGRGFKHMMYHGKRVYHLLQGNQMEADKYKKQEEQPMIMAKL